MTKRTPESFTCTCWPSFTSPGCPMVSGVRSFFANCSRFLDHFLDPLVALQDNYFRDTGHLIATLYETSVQASDCCLLVTSTPYAPTCRRPPSCFSALFRSSWPSSSFCFPTTPFRFILLDGSKWQGLPWVRSLPAPSLIFFSQFGNTMSFLFFL